VSRGGLSFSLASIGRRDECAEGSFVAAAILLFGSAIWGFNEDDDFAAAAVEVDAWRRNENAGVR